MALRVAINGFGRIGRLVRRVAEPQVKEGNIEFLVVNDLSDADTLAYLLRRDSAHKQFDARIETSGDYIKVDGREMKVISEKNPANLPWGDMGIDLVIESTGRFKTREDISKHLQAGAKYVILTVPAKSPKDVDYTLVLGVNEEGLDLKKHHILSNASCTTNSLAPMVYVLREAGYNIESGLLTTIHAYTNDQHVCDQLHKDKRRARAAATNIIPTSTGAAKAIGVIFPELEGKIDGIAMRVPVLDGSISDFVALLKNPPESPEEVNEKFRQYAEGKLSSIMQYDADFPVSGDIIGNPSSCIFDPGLTRLVGGKHLKICGWYDNELGYSNRVVDSMRLVKAHLGK